MGRRAVRAGPIAALIGMALSCGVCQAQDQAATTLSKDVRLDAPAVPGAATPSSGTPPVPRTGAPAEAGMSTVPTASARAATDVPTATAAPAANVVQSLAGLGLSLLSGQSRGSDDDAHNEIVSPVSLASTLGLIHAGAKHDAAREMASLFAPAPAGDILISKAYPDLLDSLDIESGELRMLHRIWVARSSSSAIMPSYLGLIRDRYQAGADIVDFRKPEQARGKINRWAAAQTRQRIKQLLAQGAVTRNTHLIATSSVHFRAAWAQQFTPASTTAKPFAVDSGPAPMVPTMVQLMRARVAEVDGAPILEIPFAANRFTLLIAQKPVGSTLGAFIRGANAGSWGKWSSMLEPLTCSVELPRFAIRPRSMSLKPSLQGLGMRISFTSQADYSGMLGGRAKGVTLDDLFQSAGIEVDEYGAEAVAATAAVMAPKSIVRAQAHPACMVNRPFIFSIVERETGLPVFMGKIAVPQA